MKKPSTSFLVQHAKWIVTLFVLAFFVFGFLGYFKPIEIALTDKRFSFKVANIHFSLYLLIKAVLVLIITFWTTKIVSSFGERRIRRLKGVRPSNKTLLTKAFQILTYAIAFFILLDLLGIDLTTLTVFSGAIGIGLGFGLQKITSNFISGIILLFEKSIEDDDLVELTDGTFGTVKHTSARYTLLETHDGKEVMIPNEDFVIGRVTNWTYSNTKGRISIPIGVSYSSDIELAQKLILQAAQEDPGCTTNPSPECYLQEFADNSVNFILFFWVEDIVTGRHIHKNNVMLSIWRKFADNNIVIPFPQRDIHINHPISITRQ